MAGISGGECSLGVVMLVLSSRLLSFLTERSLKSSGARAWGSKCDLIALLLIVHLFLISGHGWVVGVLLGGCRPVRDEDGSRVGKNSVRRFALRGKNSIRWRNVRRQGSVEAGN